MRRWRWMIGFCVSLLVPTLSWSAAATPTLPTATVDTTFPTITGGTCNAATAAAFQTCLNNAALDSEIVLTAGVTYAGEFTLPNKTTGSGWIVIRTSNMAGLPAEGTRVVPATHASAMPILQPLSTDPFATVFATNTSAHHYRFVGLQIRAIPGDWSWVLMQIGNGSESTLAQLPHHLIVDRVYMHGDASEVNGTRRPYIAYGGQHLAVIDSYVSDGRQLGGEGSAGVSFAHNADGPIKLVNNFIEGAGISLSFGGGTATITNVQPHDVTIQRNTISKNLAWNPNDPSYGGNAYDALNDCEITAGLRFLIEGNIFQHSWGPLHHGRSLSLRPKNGELLGTGGTSPNAWNQLADFTIRHNIFRGMGRGIVVRGLAEVGDAQTLRTTRVQIVNNLLEDMRTGEWNGTGLGFQIQFGPTDLIIDHNTVIAQSQLAYLSDEVSANFTMRNNIFQCPSGGCIVSDSGEGNITFTNWTSSPVFIGNALIGRSSGTYSNFSGNFFPANATAVGWVTYNNGAYNASSHAGWALAAGSSLNNAATDGTDVGVDIAALDAAMAAVTDTGPPTAPTGLTLTVLSSSVIQLDWTAATDDVGVTNYRVYRCSGAACTPTTLTTLGNVLTFQSTGLTPSTLYRFQVSALDAVPTEGSLSSTQQATTSAAPSPVALIHVPLNDTATPSLDVIGGLSCTWTGTPSSVAGQFSTGVGVDGAANSWLNCGTNVLAAPASPFTLAFWMKVTGAIAQFNGVLSRTTGESWNDGYGCYWNTATQLRCFINDVSTTEAIATVATPTNWNHVIFMVDGTNARLFINGTEGTPAAFSATVTAGGSLSLGRIPAVPYDTAGLQLDEVWLFNYALNSTERANLQSSNNVASGDVTAPAAPTGLKVVTQ